MNPTLSPNDLRRLRASILTDSLSAFVKAFWCVLEPGALLHWGWHLDALCEHLEAVARGDIRKLLVNVPPRSLKSTIVSVCFPAWQWLRNPTLRFLSGSYGLGLAMRDAVRSRDLIDSRPYVELVGGTWQMKDDQNAKSRYENSRTGTRICTAVDAGATGEGGNFVIVDDPHNARDLSELALSNVRDWLDKTLSTRLNNPKTDSRVLVMQRLHEGDASAHVLTQGWEHLMLPTLYEPDHPLRSKTSLNFIDKREPGELLCPEQFGEAEVIEAEIALGSVGFAGQHQQRPSPGKGTLFDRAMFRFWDIPPDEFDRMLFSWDLSFKGPQEKRGSAGAIRAITDPSFVVGDLWGFKGNACYLLDQVRGQWDYTTTKRHFENFSAKYPDVLKKLVEAKANGAALESDLQGSVGGIELVEPKGGKEARAMAMQPRQHAGYIYLPARRHALWVDSWLDEVCGFPLARHNDRVDTMSQAVNYVHSRGTMTSQDRLQALSKMGEMVRGIM